MTYIPNCYGLGGCNGNWFEIIIGLVLFALGMWLGWYLRNIKEKESKC